MATKRTRKLTLPQPELPGQMVFFNVPGVPTMPTLGDPDMDSTEIPIADSIKPTITDSMARRAA